jgi:hypothetical protein
MLTICLTNSNTILIIAFHGGGRKKVIPKMIGVSTVSQTDNLITQAGLGQRGCAGFVSRGGSGVGFGFCFHGAGARHLALVQYSISGGFNPLQRMHFHHIPDIWPPKKQPS